MNLLLDTHALIWWFDDSPLLRQAAKVQISNPDNTIFVSAVSAWEIFTKHRLGKLPQANALVGDFIGRLQRNRFFELPVTVQHAAKAGGLLGDHKDPFDRMLIAQALEEDLTLVSNEAAFDKFGIKRLW